MSEKRPRTELCCTDIIRAAVGEPVKREGDELLYHCVNPAHQPDKHPSLKINAAKNVWMCGPCAASGTAWALAAFIAGIDPNEKQAVTGWLKLHGLLNGHREILTTYPYLDETGHLLYEIVRYKPKDFSARRPNGSGDWIDNLHKVRRVLYNLPDVLKATPDDLVLLTEGEKDANTAKENLGFIATTNPGGAGKWRPEYNAFLEGKRVCIICHDDGTGFLHGREVADQLLPGGQSIKLIERLPNAKDLTEWVERGGTKEQLLAIIADTPELDASTRSPSDTSTAKPSQIARLLSLISEADLFCAPDGRPYATLCVSGHKETYPIISASFKRHLIRTFYEAEKTVPRSESVHEAVDLAAAKAHVNPCQKNVYLRVAEHEGRIFLDLADPERRVVEISTSHWTITLDPPVRFRRTKGMLPLPVPIKEGDFGTLRQFLNVPDNHNWLLIEAWATQALKRPGPYPLLLLTGEEGTAKTSAAHALRSLIDPSVSPTRSIPRDERDLMIAAFNSHALAFDNLSHIEPWLSDALCRLSTGGGFATRELYTDLEETIINAQCPILITGIEDCVVRGDLQDRTIAVELPQINPDRRRDEEKFWSDFKQCRPAILGGLLNRISTALRNLPSVVIENKPRMAGFALWATAAEDYPGLRGGPFLKAYMDSRELATASILESSLIADAIRKFMDQQSDGTWDGSFGELLEELNTQNPDSSKKDRGWPKTAKGLSNGFTRIAPALRSAGIFLTRFPRKGGKRPIRIIRDDTPNPCDGQNSLSTHSEAANLARSDDSDRCDGTADDLPPPQHRVIEGEV